MEADASTILVGQCNVTKASLLAYLYAESWERAEVTDESCDTSALSTTVHKRSYLDQPT